MLLGGGAIAASLLLPAGGAGDLPWCAFQATTGLSCPGCGLTRGFVALAHGRFAEAWRFHPFTYPLFLLALAGLAAPWLVRKGWTPSPRQVGWGLGLLSAAMVLFGGLRLIDEVRTRSASSGVSASGPAARP